MTHTLIFAVLNNVLYLQILQRSIVSLLATTYLVKAYSVSDLSFAVLFESGYDFVHLVLPVVGSLQLQHMHNDLRPCVNHVNKDIIGK